VRNICFGFVCQCRYTGYHRWRVVVVLAAVLLSLVATRADVESQSTLSGWSPPINFSEAPETFSDSPILICDDNQNLHVLWIERGDSQAVVYYRTDASGDWSRQNDVLLTQSITYMDATATADGILHLVWVTSHSAELQYTQVPLSRASDPRRWQDPVTLMEGVDSGSNVFAGGGTIRSDDYGRLHVVVSIHDDEQFLSHSLLYLRSDTKGQTWQKPVVVSRVTSPVPSDVFGGLAIDVAGRLHLVWQTRSHEYGIFSKLEYTRSLDEGMTWEPPLVLAQGSAPFGVAMPAVYAFGRDEIHLTWSTPDRLHSWSVDGGVTWSTPRLIMDLGAAFGGFNRLVKDSAGTLYAVAAVGDGVYSAQWLGTTWSAMEPIDRRDIDPHTQQLTVCQGNQLYVVYHDRTGDNEIWYSTKTTAAPQLTRLPITQNEELATPALEIAIGQPLGSTAGPVIDRELTPVNGEMSNATGTEAFAPVLIGALAAAVVVVAALIHSLSRWHR